MKKRIAVGLGTAAAAFAITGAVAPTASAAPVEKAPYYSIGSVSVCVHIPIGQFRISIC
ncbi:hypothetical protein [Gordonia sp. (in: high G+C Gram-positive bacteria)]|uniref:hypothetical protein n=1 Tax=Gordonia sp. (in: high G+C Gram-positive bacteria) TaxID=84139 RepID=UPI001D715986|nr:hypothetical protein [Gordonia sp. (in: high G+C Gram-positive bacteria)]MCB1294610.1 hypothetical protein [Gordonia sp. (in: high G+C Gram-positive bacteria)]HMS76550.1 hypothetical protein [Gordonia sp. (in: high G+C Gram-positive bacteria)]HQV17990.1 hypothetical protein [Gordonia sp. (in: high G+C Gram-positive bacteria)]